jgi:hypothetical protein
MDRYGKGSVGLQSLLTSLGSCGADNCCGMIFLPRCSERRIGVVREHKLSSAGPVEEEGMLLEVWMRAKW